MLNRPTVGNKIMLLGKMYPFNRKQYRDGPVTDKIKTFRRFHTFNTGLCILSSLNFRLQHPMSEIPVYWDRHECDSLFVFK